MGKLHQQGNWIIRVQGNEHSPVHVHVIHPDGKAIVHLDGSAESRRAHRCHRAGRRLGGG